jgi:hypothetical protein
MKQDNQDRICRLGAKAWKRLKSEASYRDWIAVAEALSIGRDWAMKEAGKNCPQGRGYNTAFSTWLQRYKLDDLGKMARSRALQLFDNLPQIEAWRASLTADQRAELNYPGTILRKWHASKRPVVAKKPRLPAQTTQDIHKQFVEMARRLPREDRIRVIDTMIKDLGLNIRDWVSWVQLGGLKKGNKA